MIKSIIKTGLFLFTVSALSGILLAYSESVTKPLIDSNQRKIEQDAQNAILPSKSFKEITEGKDTFTVGYNENNKPNGAIFKVAPKGFGGAITMLVGINADGKVTGYKILSHTETPGLGAKLLSNKFKTDFENLLKANPSPVFKVKKDGGNVDAITAATISSRAFCSGINTALSTFNNLKSKILASASETTTSGGSQK